MKSRIIVDISTDNSPIIKVDLVHNEEDLRDKVLKKFFQSLSYSSNWLFAKPMFDQKMVPETGWVISPIGDHELLDTCKEIISRLNKLKLHDGLPGYELLDLSTLNEKELRDINYLEEVDVSEVPDKK